jgi:hypothetical protein
VLSHRVMLDVPFQLAVFVSGLLAEHRHELGTREGTRRRAAGCAQWRRRPGRPRWREGPDGRCASGPSVQSANTCSAIA